MILKSIRDSLNVKRLTIDLGMFVKIGSEFNVVKRINGESTLEQISILLLPVLDHLTVHLDPLHLNIVERVILEVDHLFVLVLDIIVHILSLLDDHSAKENQAEADLTASLVVRNLVLIFKRENAHVVLVANMNTLAIKATEDILLRGLPLPQEGSQHHPGVLVVGHLFRMPIEFVMQSGMVKLVSGVTSVYTHTRIHLLLVHLVPTREETVIGQPTAPLLKLFARGGP